ncbi:hypothetical protein EV192_1011675 [Actinocrispum wychmicini]|uniref:Uncharacterized protein n=1 Tax=Actinocrispum wychmicini TaxID=1213861 RepID=A0A4R2JZ34_9PSEU|nr:hypothetical protein EV192_1011675 [Actinocrispum wychmicini]
MPPARCQPHRIPEARRAQAESRSRPNSPLPLLADHQYQTVRTTYSSESLSSEHFDVIGRIRTDVQRIPLGTPPFGTDAPRPTNLPLAQSDPPGHSPEGSHTRRDRQSKTYPPSGQSAASRPKYPAHITRHQGGLSNQPISGHRLLEAPVCRPSRSQLNHSRREELTNSDYSYYWRPCRVKAIPFQAPERIESTRANKVSFRRVDGVDADDFHQARLFRINFTAT